MPTTTIIAKYVNPPQAGKKLGSIKTPEGEYFGIPSEWVNQFTQGASYDVEYTESDFRGKTYKKIGKFVMAQGAAPAQMNSGASAGKYGATDDKTAERIFVCGALNAAIHSGKLELVTTDIIEATQTLRAAWSQTFGRPNAPARQPLNEEIGDQVPF